MNPARILATSIAEKIVLPEVYHRIKGLIIKPDIANDDFVDVINMDSSLAIHIVDMANSDFLGYARKSKTVKQALSVLGAMQVHDLLLSILAIRAFSGIPSVLIDQHAFWRSCVYCGIIARLLAKKCSLPAGERLFTLGLLHEIGHLVMYAKIPEATQDVLLESLQSETPLHLLERNQIGFDYGQVGSEVMRLWHLPDSYSDIAKHHMEPEIAQSYQQEIAIVNLARSIMLADEVNGISPEALSLDTVKEVFDVKMSMAELEIIKAQARAQIEDTLRCLMTAYNGELEC